MNLHNRMSPDEWNGLRERNTTQLRQAVEAVERRFNDGERRLREEMKCVGDLFRQLKPTEREEHSRLWAQFNSLRDRMSQEYREFSEQQKCNATRIESALDDLIRRHGLSHLDEMARDANRLFALPEGQRIDFGAIWRDIHAVQELFKECRPLRREEQQRLWDRFNGYRDRVREFQNMHRDRYERDCDDSRNEIARAIQTLQSTYNLGWGQDWLGQGGLKGFGDDARAVSELFKTCKPLRKADREELWNSFNRVRDKANEVRDLKQQQWRSGQCEHAERLRGFMEKNEAFIEQLQSRIESDRERRDSARSSDFADTVQGWIDEKESKIREVEDRNSELSAKIADIERRLDS